MLCCAVYVFRSPESCQWRAHLRRIGHPQCAACSRRRYKDKGPAQQSAIARGGSGIAAELTHQTMPPQTLRSSTERVTMVLTLYQHRGERAQA